MAMHGTQVQKADSLKIISLYQVLSIFGEKTTSSIENALSEKYLQHFAIQTIGVPKIGVVNSSIGPCAGLHRPRTD